LAIKPTILIVILNAYLKEIKRIICYLIGMDELIMGVEFDTFRSQLLCA
jgi:hypothetical protein